MTIELLLMRIPKFLTQNSLLFGISKIAHMSHFKNEPYDMIHITNVSYQKWTVSINGLNKKRTILEMDHITNWQY